jgi:hypothetical protein
LVVRDDGPVCADVCCCHNFVCVCPPSYHQVHLIQPEEH